MNIFLNPLFLTRLAGLIALAVSLYFPGANEEKLAGFVTMLLAWVSGKFEKQPDAAKTPAPVVPLPGVGRER